ncbi:hypothetical protein TNCV_1005711 [Trichonephila clavipes]|nr:hypothetical protein TNCV_1005711 [Trichonephila clavipes]
MVRTATIPVIQYHPQAESSTNRAACEHLKQFHPWISKNIQIGIQGVISVFAFPCGRRRTENKSSNSSTNAALTELYVNMLWIWIKVFAGP